MVGFADVDYNGKGGIEWPFTTIEKTEGGPACREEIFLLDFQMDILSRSGISDSVVGGTG